ncbi:MAG: lipoyl(octanoyl) transferase LipB [Candidatus Binatia bacterium]
MPTLLYKDLGRLEYLTALSLQQRLLEEKQAGTYMDMLLLVEHPHVFTSGRAGKEKNMLDRGDVPFHIISRGGDITYHGPGQMVAYPLLDLRSTLRRDVHDYLRNLERVLIQTVKLFGISAKRVPPWTGVWIENRKIASIGIAVRKGITYHGMALNVSPDLSYFSRIIPCGLPWALVTSMERELGREIDPRQVKEAFIDCFAKRFQYTELEELCLEDIPTGLKLEPQAAQITFA